MRIHSIAGLGMAAMLTVGTAAVAQTVPASPVDRQTQPPQSPSHEMPAPDQKSQKSDQTMTMTLVGCLMKESDYRRAHNLGSGALGGAGLGDEFVLVDASTTPASGAPAAPSSQSGVNPTGASTRSSSGTCTEQGTGQAYRLTGKQEEAPLKALVGRRVEVTGRMKHETTAASANTASTSKLPAEVEIVSYREAGGSPAAAPAMDERAPAPSRDAASPPVPASIPPASPSSANAGRARTDSSRTELSHTAGPDALVGLIGLLSLGTGWTLRRRAH